MNERLPREKETMLFDQALLLKRRQRFSAQFPQHDFLHAEAADRLLDRLAEVRRRFQTIAILGDLGRYLQQGLARLYPDHPAPQTLDPIEQAALTGNEMPLLPAHSFDLILSNLALQSINDLPGFLQSVKRALKPDGLFLGVLLGGDSLVELRHALMDAEIACLGGASPRLHPVVAALDLTGLLQQAGYAMPVVDGEKLTIDYGDFGKLLTDLRVQGGNVLSTRHRRPVPRAFWSLAAQDYATRFSRTDGRLVATLELIFFAAWAPE